jgi:hypothetical protein
LARVAAPRRNARVDIFKVVEMLWYSGISGREGQGIKNEQLTEPMNECMNGKLLMRCAI